MVSDSDVTAILTARSEVIQSALANQRARAPSRTQPIYANAHRSLDGSNNLLGITVLAAAEACPPESTAYTEWTPAALAVEYLAAFARTHDTTMALKQSGCSERESGGDTCMTDRLLTGDLLFTRATELVLELETAQEIREKCLKTVTTTGRYICEGKALGHQLTRQMDVQLDDYLRFVDQSTALWQGSATLGGLLGKGTDTQISHLKSFGQNVGAAIRLSIDADRLSQPSTKTASKHDTADPSYTRSEQVNDSRTLLSASLGTLGTGDGDRVVNPESASVSHIPTHQVDANDLRRRAGSQLDDARAHIASVSTTNPSPVLTAIIEQIRTLIS
jgi:hypothetical protein